MTKWKSYLSSVIFILVLLTSQLWASSPDKRINFTPDELSWIKAHPEITLVVNNGPQPISFWGETGGPPLPEKRPGQFPRPPTRPPAGTPTGLPPGAGPPLPPKNIPLTRIGGDQTDQFNGVAAEYLKEIQALTGIRFTPVLLSFNNYKGMVQALEEGKADLIPVILTGQPLMGNLKLTRPYIQVPLVVVMSQSSPSYGNVKDLLGLRVAGVMSVQPKLHPLELGLKIIHTSPQQGLVGVSTGKFDAFICELSTVSHVLALNPVKNIKIAGELPVMSAFAMAVSPRLKAFVPIFNKALSVISEDKKDAIRGKWFTVTYEKKWTTSPWFWGIIAALGLMLILGFLGLFYYRRRLNQIKTAVEALDPHLLSAHINQDFIITQVTQALCRVTGFKPYDLVGNPLMALGSPVAGKSGTMEALWQTISRGNSWKGEVKLVKKDGSTLWTEAIISPLRRKRETSEGFTVIYQDVSQRKHFERLAARDELTGLFNRRQFNILAPKLLKRANRETKALALILMDVDNFKSYNDTYGHPEGDKVLSAIGATLNSIFRRRSDLAFRLGGEEFGVLLLVSASNPAEDAAEKIISHIRNLGIVHKSNPPGVVTISLGIKALAPADDIVPIETIYQQADEALYQAKKRGKNQWVVYTAK